MVSLMIVVADESIDLRFEFSRQEVIFKQDPVLQRLVPALVFAAIDPQGQSLNASTSLSLRMVWRTARMGHAFLREIFSQIGGDVRRAII